MTICNLLAGSVYRTVKGNKRKRHKAQGCKGQKFNIARDDELKTYTTVSRKVVGILFIFLNSCGGNFLQSRMPPAFQQYHRKACHFYFLVSNFPEAKLECSFGFTSLFFFPASRGLSRQKGVNVPLETK